MSEPRTLSVPVDTLSAARLVFPAGASRLTLTSGAADGELLGARFDQQAPAIETTGSVITVRYPRPFWRGARRYRGALALHDRVPWMIDVDGGAAHVDAQLAGVRLAGLRIGSGAAHVALDLPAPRGAIAIAIAGGAHDLRLRRPVGVPVRVVIGAGAVRLALDGLRLGAVGGELAWQSPGYEQARDRYEITVEGGVAGATIEEAAPLALAPYRDAPMLHGDATATRDAAFVIAG
jgi:hypothetical protein